MATVIATKKSKIKSAVKAQPKIYTFEWKGLNRDGKKTSGELRGENAAVIKIN